MFYATLKTFYYKKEHASKNVFIGLLIYYMMLICDSSQLPASSFNWKAKIINNKKKLGELGIQINWRENVRTLRIKGVN